MDLPAQNATTGTIGQCVTIQVHPLLSDQIQNTLDYDDVEHIYYCPHDTEEISQKSVRKTCSLSLGTMDTQNTHEDLFVSLKFI